MKMPFSCSLSIDDLLQESFSERTSGDQCRIILEGKPRPQLDDVYINAEEFDVSFYDTELWVTACDKRNSFYCWFCLLFDPDDESEWTTVGYSNFEDIYDALERHDCTDSHQTALQKHQRFVLENLIPEMPPTNIADRNEFLKNLLNFMCTLLSQTSYPAPKVKNFDKYIVTKCIRTINLYFKKYQKRAFTKAMDNFTQPGVFTTYIETLSLMVKNAIKEEISNATYVSIIINEHCVDESGILISIVLRYLKNENICERFSHFFFLTSYETIESLVSNIMIDCEIWEKVVAFSTDSAMTSLAQLKLFVDHMRKVHGSLFVPCYFHCFETIIARRVSEVDERCSLFFKTLSSMRQYIKGCSNMLALFKKFVTEDFHINRECFKFIIILKNHKSIFINFFNNVKQNMDDWMEDDVIKAIGYRKILYEPYTIFLIETFFALAPTFVEINEILRSSTPERIFEDSQCRRYKTILSDMKTHFPRIWDISCEEMKALQPNIFDSSEYEETFRSEAQNTFDTVIKAVIEEYEIRIVSFVKYRNYFKICTPNSESLFPTNRKKLVNFPTHVLNPTELRNEIKKLRGENPDLMGKTIYDVFKFLVTEKLQGKFKSLFKTLEVALTIPCKPAALDEEISRPGKRMKLDDEAVLSKLDLINTWSRVYHAKQTVTNNWSLLSIEKDIFKSLSKRKQFCPEFYSSFKKDYPLFEGL